MHSALARKSAYEAGSALLLLPANESLEEREAAVGQSDGLEQRILNGRLRPILLHYGGQLFVIANQDKPLNGRPSASVGICFALLGIVERGRCAEQPDDIGFKNLRSLVYHGQ